jgi:hypothetical protein
MYPCQYPDCPARYDETRDGIVDGTGATLTGWQYPWDEEVSGDTPEHEHILNVMHKVEVDDTECIGLTADPDGPELKEKK